MCYPNVGALFVIFFEPGIVETPVMREIGTHQYNIPGIEPLHIVAHELGASSLFKMDQFHFGVEMPAGIDVRYEIPSYAKRMSGLPGNFKQLRSHDNWFEFIMTFFSLGIPGSVSDWN